MKKNARTTNVSDEGADVVRRISEEICVGGFVPETALREKFGDTAVTRALALLYRTHRVVREAIRPVDGGESVKGYEWADRRFSKAQRSKVPPEFAFILEMGQKGNPSYGDYRRVSLLCRWTNKVLAAIPGGKKGEEEVMVFDRDEADNVLIPGYCVRAMLQKALRFSGRPASIAFNVGYETVKVESPDVKLHRRPVIDQRGQGLGINCHESLGIGTEFALTVLLPTTALTVTDYIDLVRVAGKFVRFSPARSSAFGDFEVVKVLEQ